MWLQVVRRHRAMSSVLSPDELEQLTDLVDGLDDGVNRLRSVIITALIESFPRLPAVRANEEALRAIVAGDASGVRDLEVVLYRERTRLEELPNPDLVVSRLGQPVEPPMDPRVSMLVTTALARALYANGDHPDIVFDETSDLLGFLAGSGAEVLVSERLRVAFGLR